MRFYRVSGTYEGDFFDGEFQPYPDLDALFLSSVIPHDSCISIASGSRPGDIISSSFNVVSERFLAALEVCGATGFTAIPVKVVHGGTSIPGYSIIKLLGRGGAFDEERSEADRQGSALFGYSGIYMDERQWDGSDVFAIPGLGIGMFVTEKVKESLERARLSGVEIVLNSECRFGSHA